MPDPLDLYRRKIENNLRAGNATEHTHRPALKTFLESLQDGLSVTNEPRHHAECGAPDMAVLQNRPRLVVGHVETKDIGVSLADAHKTDQLKRYRKYLPNLILTDYIYIRWYLDGELFQEASLGTADTTAGRIRTTSPCRNRPRYPLTADMPYRILIEAPFHRNRRSLYLEFKLIDEDTT